MTIPVNIDEAKTRLPEPVAAAMRGEEVVLRKSGLPQVRLVAIEDAVRIVREAIAERRVAAIGMFKHEFDGVDTSFAALQSSRRTIEERQRSALGPDL